MCGLHALALASGRQQPCFPRLAIACSGDLHDRLAGQLIESFLTLFSTAVDGVVIYLTDYQRSITERLAKASRVASSQGISCRRPLIQQPCISGSIVSSS